MFNDIPHVRWLYEELPLWREKGWLSETSEAEIRARYGPIPGTDHRRWTTILISVLAALLIGGGVILILAHNWDDLSRPLRAGLSVFPLLVTYVLGAFVLRSRFDSAAWREGVATANVCASAAAVALVAQTYNISGDTASFLFTVCLLALPALYLFRSVGSGMLYLFGIALLRLSAENDSSTVFYGYGWECFWGMLALFLPFAALRFRKGAVLGAQLLCLGLFFAIAFSLIPDTAKSLETAAIFALFFSLVVGLSSWRVTSRFLFPILPRLAAFGLLVILMNLSFGDNWRASYSPLWQGSVESGVLLAVLTLGTAVLLTFAVRARDGFASIWTALGLAVAFLCAFLHTVTFLTVPELMVNLLGLGVGAATMFLGYRQGHLLRVNGGLAVVGGILLMRFFDSDIPMLMRGVGFIFLGAAFLYVNTRLSRKMKESRS